MYKNTNSENKSLIAVAVHSITITVTSNSNGKKIKASHTRYRAWGLELILVYRQSARRWLKSSTRW